MIHDGLEVLGLFHASEITIRPARLDDATRVAEVRVTTWRSTYRDLLPADYFGAMSIERTAKRWTQIIANPVMTGPDRSCDEAALVLVAEHPASGVVGYVHFAPTADGSDADSGEVYAIYVLPEFQGRGAGSALLSKAASHLVRYGFNSLLVWVWSKNPAAKFYESMGGCREFEREIEIAGVTVPEIGYTWQGDAFRGLA